MLEAYKIGIKLQLLDGVTSGLIALGGRFRRTSQDVEQLQKRIEGVKRSMAIGVAEAGAGVGLLAMFKPAMEAASAYQLQLAKLGAMGFGDNITNQAAKAARSMQIMGASVIQTTEAMRDALGIVPQLSEAKLLAPTLAKVPFAAKMYGLDAGGATRSALNMMRAAEQREGMGHPHAILRAVNEMWKMAAFSGFRLGGNDFRALSATGSTAFKLLSSRGLMNLEPALQEMGGSRVGTALMSAYQGLIMGQMLVGNSTVINTLQKLHLPTGHDLLRAKDGHIKRLMPGAVVGTNLLMRDPATWFATVFTQHAMRYGGAKNLDDLMKLSSEIQSNRTGKTLAAILLQNAAAIPLKTSQIMKSDDIDQAATRYGGTAAGRYAAAGAAWETAKVNFGVAALPWATKALAGLTHLIQNLTALMKHHATATKILAGSLISLGAGLAIDGTVRVVTAAFRGLGLALAFDTVGGAAGIAKIGSALAIVGTSLASGLSALAAAGYAGWKVGGWINHGIDWMGGKITGQQGWNLGGQIYDWTHHMTAAGGRGMVQVHHQTVLDGKVLTDTVTHHQARNMERPNAGPNQPSWGMTYGGPSMTAGIL